MPSSTDSAAGKKKAAEIWTKIAQAAPPAVKADAQKVATFLQGYAQGKIDATAATQAGPALQRVSEYAVKHCFGR